MFREQCGTEWTLNKETDHYITAHKLSEKNTS